MNIEALSVTKDQAIVALKEYREHRGRFDSLDWEIERIYRAIAKGKLVINVRDAIVDAGVDQAGRPRLAICQAHALECVCFRERDRVLYGMPDPCNAWKGIGKITVPWPGMGYGPRLMARVPRIPPQHRPEPNNLSSYHLLWEADWQDIPHDPYLLRRIGRDAWVVVAAWDLTAVELSVLRAREVAR